MTDLEQIIVAQARELATELGFTLHLAVDGAFASLTGNIPEIYAGTPAECRAFLTGWKLRGAWVPQAK